MTQRSYNQYCPIAHALDLIGERWSLLIVRDLLLGPKRFSDLRAGLPGLGTNILTDRLKGLEEAGVIARRILPPPAASAVYELTPYGRGLDGPLQALAQWGGQSLGGIQPGQAPSRDSILLTVRALARQLFADHGVRSVAVLLNDERFSETIVARAEGDEVRVFTDTPAEAKVEFSLDLDALFALAGGALTLREALAQGMAEGLVRREAEGGRHTRERQRYHITDAGRAALEVWLATPGEPEGTRNELALKLYFGQSAPPAASQALLQAHREHHRRLLARYAEDQPELEARAAAGEPGAVSELITLSLGVHISTARVAWCDEALNRLALLDPSTTSSGA